MPSLFRLQWCLIAVLLLDFLENIRVRRTEVILINFAWMNPADIIVLQCLRISIGNGALEQCEANQNIRVFVNNLHELTTHIYLNV